MKKTLNILVIIALAIVVGLGLNSCDKDEEADYDSIVPVVLGVNGPTSVIAHGSVDHPSQYKLSYYRGGSTINWSVETATGIGDETIVITTYDEESMINYSMDIVFPKREDLDTAIVTVVEETSAGLVSEPYMFDVILNPFCAQDIDYWVGTYTGTESIGGGDPENITVTITKKDATTLVIEAQDGVPGLLQSVYTSWGETFQETYGELIGDIELIYDPFSGQLLIEDGTYWGRTEPDDYDYWYAGSGTWDGCNDMLKIHFEMHYDDYDFSDGGNRWSYAELTKDNVK